MTSFFVGPDFTELGKILWSGSSLILFHSACMTAIKVHLFAPYVQPRYQNLLWITL